MKFNRDVLNSFLVLPLIFAISGTLQCDARPVIKRSATKPAAPVNTPRYNNSTSPSVSQSLSPAPVNIAFPAIAQPLTTTPKIPVSNVTTTSKKWITQQINPAAQAELTRLEQATMMRSYQTDSETSRLGRLENLIFGQSHEKDSPEHRLSALSAIVPETPKPMAQDNDDNELSVTAPQYQQQPLQQATAQQQSPSQQQPNVSGYTAPADPQLAAKIDGIEMKMFNRTFSNESVDSRISRMEKIEFNSTAPELSDNDRLDRVASVMRAHASSTEEKITQNFGIPGVSNSQAVSNITGLPQNLTQGRPINSNNPNGPRRVKYATPGSGLIMSSPGYNSGYSSYNSGGMMFGTGMRSGSIGPQIMMMIFSALTRSPFP